MYTSTQRGTSGISSGSIDALRVQLMKMNAQQLQAFAQANQDDAIKLGLAAEADKYKKQHAQEAMALMSGQQQKPPIAQQILQSIGQPPQQQQPQGPQQGQGPMPPQGQGGPMPPQGMPPQGMPPQQMAQGPMPPQGMADGGYVLPEDQGIATLPVGGMDFAEGGIVGYADRGLVKGGFMMPPEIPDGAIVMGNMYKDPDTGEMRYLPGAEPQPNPYRGMTLPEFYDKAKSVITESLENPSQYMTPAQVRQIKAEKQNKIAESQNKSLLQNTRPRRSENQQFESEVAKRNNLPDPTATAVTTPGAGAAPPVPPAALDKRGLPSGPKLVDPTMPQQGGLGALATTSEDLQRIYGNMVPPAADPFEGRIRNIGEMEQANAAAALAQRRQDIEDLGPAYTEREAKLKDRQGRIEKEEGKLPYMAMLEAGLAMMGGTSPHAFVNIGAGGATGVKSYKQGIDKLTDAKDRLDDAFGRIEEARRGEKVLNAKELRELENNVRKTVTQTEKDVLSGAQQAYGLSQQQAGKMFDAYVKNKSTEFEQGEQTKRTIIQERGANARTNMTANAPTGLERILSNPVLFEKYMKSQTGAANVRAESALRQEWAENPMVRQQYPKIEDYLMANGVGGQAGGGTGLKFLGSRPAQ